MISRFLAAVIFFALISPALAQTALNGAGATAPYPLLAKWIDAYERETGVRINYQSVGNGAGRNQMRQKVVDFAVSHRPLDEATYTAMPFPIREIPFTATAIAVVYNLREVPNLRLSGEVLADIYRGQVTHWNDARIRKLNPGASLPARRITVLKRTDGSASTWAITQFLAASSTHFARELAPKNPSDWPAGIGGRSGTGDYSGFYRTPGSLGYAEAAFSQQNRLQIAQIRNREGAFVAPDLKGVVAALNNNAPVKLGVAPSMINPRGAKSYPIVTVSTLLIPAQSTFKARNHEVRRFARWALKSGQKFNAPLLYAPLPTSWRAHSNRELDAFAP